MTEISISYDGRDLCSEFQEKIAASENSGAAAVWIANHLFQRDPVTLAAMALAQTKRMRLALMAMSPLTMHPVQAAMSAATLDEFFPGRVKLCLGVGTPGDLKSVGIEAEKPLRMMREALELSRTLLAGETVRVDGEFFCVQGRRLGSGARPVPIVLAASGPRMLELARAAADGVLLSAGTSIEFVKRSLDIVFPASVVTKILVGQFPALHWRDRNRRICSFGVMCKKILTTRSTNTRPYPERSNTTI
jgi:5,10-methylenetetrahydromethanopterin reductase